MVLVKILKRKDAASLIIAIIVATAISQALFQMTFQPAADLIGADNPGGDGGFYGPGWKITYLQPLVALALQLVVLELLARITILVISKTKKSNRR